MKSADKTKGHSLSSAQAGIWMAQVLDPDNPVFNIAEYTEIGGAVMPGVFESALRRVISEAEALHVRVGEVDGKSRQYMVPDEGWQFLFMDVSSECDPQSVAESWMRADLACAVDLRKDRLFAYALFRLS